MKREVKSVVLQPGPVGRDPSEPVRSQDAQRVSRSNQSFGRLGRKGFGVDGEIMHQKFDRERIFESLVR